MYGSFLAGSSQQAFFTFIQFRVQPMRRCHPHSGWIALLPLTIKILSHKPRHRLNGSRQFHYWDAPLKILGCRKVMCGANSPHLFKCISAAIMYLLISNPSLVLSAHWSALYFHECHSLPFTCEWYHSVFVLLEGSHWAFALPLALWWKATCVWISY